MPELIEVEAYRQLADRVVGRQVAKVHAPDAWYVKGGATTSDVVALASGALITATRRRGKLLLVDLAERPTLGLRFGMTGRLLLDGTGPIDYLEYAPRRANPAWDRFALRFTDGSELRITDPRRLGAVEIEPDEHRLGPDAASLTARELRDALRGSRAPLKACLLDQARIAGLGNLLVDEILWREGVDPARPASDLADDQVAPLAREIRSTIRLLTRRGGSHCGDLQDERHRDGHCPKDGAPLLRRQVGGRTTYSCPEHQR